MQERSRRARTERGRRRRIPGPLGRHYDLESVFDAVNEDYFEGELRKPRLSWTRGRAKSVLGRYDFDADVIFISRLLDSPTVPAHVVQYVVFHEMLHVKHGTQVHEAREIVHSAAFRREERQFEFFEAANDWLENH
jgi:predicted metal-dependent hydrolase